jgi:D-beta-D-heptose 7-phosphate kinase/D-beta-D-heptose 1-phosphate adenosyltransferase
MSEARLKQTLARFQGRRVLVVGDVMLDEYWWGVTRRISPEAPVPIVEMNSRTYVPGGAANTAANIASLGGTALLGGVTGDDHSARMLADALQRTGVGATGLIRDPGRPTTTKTRIIAHSQQVVRIDCEYKSDLTLAVEDGLLSWVESSIGDIDACILSDYSKGVVSPRLAEKVIQLARSKGKPMVVDPKGINYTKYRGATVIKPNLHEAERFLKREFTTEASLVRGGRQLLSRLKDSAVLMTRGSQGMSLFRCGKPPLHIPSVARAVFDVTGAGDTVVGTLAMGLAAGAALEDAVRLANKAAGIVVGKVGTTTIALDDLMTELSVSATCEAGAQMPVMQ